MTIRDETTSHSASDSVSAGSTCMSLEASMRLSLEAPRTANAESPLTSSLSPSAEDAEELRRLEHWKESPFAVGLVDVTWADSRRREKEFQLQASAWLCPLVGMVGPYWIVPAFFTYPIILIVSFWTARKVIYQHVALIAVWCTLTFIMILSLSLVACRNPGIMYRQVEMPGEGWLWNDQARTFRPKNAKFDPDCQAVIEGFDHTCPWTGTGIGRQNICAFRVFLGSLVACLILDIIIITNPF